MKWTPINPENSGEPLVGMEVGTVIWINMCIHANMEGTSFVMSINKVRGLTRVWVLKYYYDSAIVRYDDNVV